MVICSFTWSSRSGVWARVWMIQRPDGLGSALASGDADDQHHPALSYYTDLQEFNVPTIVDHCSVTDSVVSRNLRNAGRIVPGAEVGATAVN